MATTVQVSDETHRLLERLKKEMGVASYDEVIRRLAEARAGLPKSLFGACKGSPPFSREPEAEHGL